MKKLSGLKYVIGAVLVIGVFVFFFKHTASAFQPKARGQDEIRLFMGRSNYNGTFNQNVPWNYLAGNKTQQKSQNNASALMRRG